MAFKQPDFQIGSRFQRLTVISTSIRRGKRRVYLCKCDCGTTCEREHHALAGAHVSSCGCARYNTRSPWKRTSTKEESAKI